MTHQSEEVKVGCRREIPLFTLCVMLLGFSFFAAVFLAPIGTLVYSSLNPAYADPASLQRLYGFLASGDFEAFLSELWNYAGNPILSAFQDEVLVSALRVSLVTSTVSCLVCTCFGLPLAYLLARYNFPGRHVLKALVELPIVLPPVVVGISLILLLGPNTPLGSLLKQVGLELVFTWRGIILAQIFVASPFFIRSAITSFEEVPVSLELAARSLGASRFKVFRSVTLPLSARGLAAGWATMWARAMGEFGATIMLSNNIPGQSYTLTTAIYWRFWAGGIYHSIAASLILLAVSFLVLLALKVFVER
ncbi:MAG: ABC transporter permease [Candidatus Jordarchaeales archaeon]